MRFSQFAGTSIVPTLARLILGLAFISIGWCKLTEWIEIPQEKADRLMELGVDVKSEVSNVPVSLNAGQSRVIFASLTQEVEPETKEQKQQQEQPPPEQSEEETPPPATEETGDAEATQETPDQEGDRDAAEVPGEPEETVEEVIEPGDVTTIYRMRRYHSATYALDARGFTKYAKYIALTEAITEFAGGALILLGLFSRLWGFALGCAMLGALYFRAMGILADTGNPLDLALTENTVQFNILIRYLALCVLAYGVMLTGPGPISLDRLLFKREPAEDDDLEIE